MRRSIIFSVIALSFALPALAASSPLLGNYIVTAERVWYDKPVLTPGFSSLTIAKPYSQETIAAATADCSSRGGVLNTCSAMCGLNGCFSTCALACEFPKVIEKKNDAVVRDYTSAKEDYDDAPKTSKGAPKTAKGKELKIEFDAANEKYAALVKAQDAERTLIKTAIGQWQNFVPLNALQSNMKSARLPELTSVQDRLYQSAFTRACDGGVLPKRLSKKYRAADTGVLAVHCNTTDDQMLVRFGSGNAKTYGTIEAYANGKWQKVKVGGAQNGWIPGGTSAVIAGSEDITALAVYQCTPSGIAWRCGCTDTSCTSPKWQVVGVE